MKKLSYPLPANSGGHVSSSLPSGHHVKRSIRIRGSLGPGARGIGPHRQTWASKVATMAGIIDRHLSRP